LQGFLFFGTAENLLTRIRLRIEDPKRPTPRYILLNFHRVTGLDSTALFSFTRMEQLARSRSITLIYAEPSPQVRRQLEHGTPNRNREVVHFVARADQGVEWCENRILQEAGLGEQKSPPSLVQQLEEILPDAEYLPELLAYFEVLEAPPGYRLIRQGEPSQDLYFVEDGQVTAVLEREGGPPIRLQTMGGGVVGEIGFYLGYNRTASIIVDVPGKIYRLSREGMQQMEKENPRAAANLHRLIVHLLAERVAHLVNTVDTLEQ
jgi:SulP family sulfate permease